MQIPLLDLKRQYRQIQDEVKEVVGEVLKSGQYILGPNVEALEEEVARYCGVDYAVGVASGTDALRLALLSLGIGKGDEVITTPFTFIATAQAITQVGATPVFVDIEEDTFNIDVGKIEEAITSRTRAILPVHLFGHSVDMKGILEVARKYDLFVIEDAAQAFGTECNIDREGSSLWKKAGSMGDVGCFSFFPTKNLGGFGDGGMVVTNNEEIAKKVRLLRVHGGSSRSYEYEMFGYNSRLDEIQAALLRVKLKYVDGWMKARQEKAALYNRLLIDTPVKTPCCKPYSRHSFCVYTIKVPFRDRLRKYLEEAKIATKVYYPVPIHLQKIYREKVTNSCLPLSDKVCKEVLSLPIYPELKEEEIFYITEKIKAFFRDYA
ncbi:DegT/DnrJ/EryC1/StrS family aminotransferase [Candidatus Aerophobetes bacterium]|nr:DegT/DnrJ/EryC1/StrS family aminotransferase [Candidatus Aerophobetes bacterium]